MKNAIILLCAGQGKRMGNPIPKMLLKLCGKPLLYWTLKNIENCSAVGAIVLVAPTGYERTFDRLVRHWRIKKVVRVVEGGKERVESTRNAFPWLPEECEWIGIHDGARPFVSPQLVKACFKGAQNSGAAILAIPTKDTVKFVNKKLKIEHTIPRTQVWSAQTPQIFRRDIAEKMYAPKKFSRIKNHSTFTDDSMLAESLGVSVTIVPSTDMNIKITTPLDLVLAESILKHRCPVKL